MKTNPIIWFEIYVQDIERAQRFYESVFQFKLENLAPPESPEASDGTRMLAFPMNMETTGAGGMLVQMKGVNPGGGGTLVYFACEDCAVEEARVVAAGGQIHRSKFSIGPYGHCSLIVDTESNMIGLHSMK